MPGNIHNDKPVRLCSDKKRLFMHKHEPDRGRKGEIGLEK